MLSRRHASARVLLPPPQASFSILSRCIIALPTLPPPSRAPLQDDLCAGGSSRFPSTVYRHVT
ncbi:hypothetical protein B0O80DRAFT_75199 [Mortierella sp. GBAus27b]|nr:hypothetical protein B0O80DRAFT_75199 [Mortierella sp. GBAus27b]